MNQYEINTEVASANSSLSSTQYLNSKFLAHCAKNGTPPEFPTAIEVADQSISISVFGHTARANARFVRTSNGSFSAEYVFRVPMGETAIEVYRFYLTSNGRVTADVQGQSIICDYNDLYIATPICSRVLLGTLRSRLFAEAPFEGG